MAHSWTDMKKFLSSNTQDFIEVAQSLGWTITSAVIFLSSNTQDFIEVYCTCSTCIYRPSFLSSNTQDFIEVRRCSASRYVPWSNS